MITEKEKERYTISRHAVITLGARWGFTIRQIRLFFELNKKPYNLGTLRVTYYRAKAGRFPRTNIPEELKQALKQKFMEAVFIELCMPVRPQFEIQGEYESSVNNLHNLQKKKAV